MAGLTRILSTIRPASGDRHSDFNRRIELTPSDLQFLSIAYIHRGLLFKKPNESPVEQLKASLSQALDRLYPLSGCLIITEHDGDVKNVSLHVECNGAGVKFVHAEAVDGFTAADIFDVPVIPTELVDCLYPMMGVSNYHAAGSDLPFLAVQVTEFADGVFVALSVNHAVADGTTFWDFFNVWSEFSRGDSAAVSRRDGFVFDRERFNNDFDFPVRIPLHFTEPPVGAVPLAPLQQRVLRFSKAKIAELKAKANAESPGADREISSFQALTAHLWVCITRSRAVRGKEIVCLVMAVGMRPRLRPPLPRSFAGNTIMTKKVTCTAGELLGRGTGWTARQINEAVSEHDGMRTREFFGECSKRFVSPSDMAKGSTRPVVAVGGSHRFDVYGNDFGWGRPLVQRSGVVGTINSLLNAFPGPEEGSVDFEATVLPVVFRALAGDPEFTHYLS